MQPITANICFFIVMIIYCSVVSDALALQNSTASATLPLTNSTTQQNSNTTLRFGCTSRWRIYVLSANLTVKTSGVGCVNAANRTNCTNSPNCTQTTPNSNATYAVFLKKLFDCSGEFGNCSVNITFGDFDNLLTNCTDGGKVTAYYVCIPDNQTVQACRDDSWMVPGNVTSSNLYVIGSWNTTQRRDNAQQYQCTCSTARYTVTIAATTATYGPTRNVTTAAFGTTAKATATVKATSSSGPTISTTSRPATSYSTSFVPTTATTPLNSRFAVNFTGLVSLTGDTNCSQNLKVGLWPICSSTPSVARWFGPCRQNFTSGDDDLVVYDDHNVPTVTDDVSMDVDNSGRFVLQMSINTSGWSSSEWLTIQCHMTSQSLTTESTSGDSSTEQKVIHSNKLSPGGIAGVVIGVTLFVLIVVVLLILFLIRSKCHTDDKELRRNFFNSCFKQQQQKQKNNSEYYDDVSHVVDGKKTTRHEQTISSNNQPDEIYNQPDDITMCDNIAAISDRGDVGQGSKPARTYGNVRHERKPAVNETKQQQQRQSSNNFSGYYGNVSHDVDGKKPTLHAQTISSNNQPDEIYNQPTDVTMYDDFAPISDRGHVGLGSEPDKTYANVRHERKPAVGDTSRNGQHMMTADPVPDISDMVTSASDLTIVDSSVYNPFK